MSVKSEKKLPARCADHYDTGKTRYDLLPPYPLEQIGRVFTYGSKKYADRNWEKGMVWGKIYGSIQRHLWAFWTGEDIDPESGLPHLAHVGTDIMMLLEYTRTKPELDDRSKT